jgi:hypothetical protein
MHTGRPSSKETHCSSGCWPSETEPAAPQCYRGRGKPDWQRGRTPRRRPSTNTFGGNRLTRRPFCGFPFAENSLTAIVGARNDDSSYLTPCSFALSSSLSNGTIPAYSTNFSMIAGRIKNLIEKLPIADTVRSSSIVTSDPSGL